MKAVLTGGIVFLFIFSASAGKFVETFDAKHLEDWQEINGHDAAPGSWEIIDSELHAVNFEILPRFLTTGDETWRDYSIEFDVKPLEKHGPGYITIASRVNGTLLVHCEIGDLPLLIPNVICLTSNLHEKRSELLYVASHPLLRINNWSTLKLGVQGDTFTLWINEKRFGQTGDDFIWKIGEDPKTHIKGRADKIDRFPTGGAGLGLSNYTAIFDNIIITGKDVPDKGTLSVTSAGKPATIWGQLKRF